MNSIDIIGSGFVLGVPGTYANCRVYYDSSGVHHIGPLYQEWNEQQAPLAPPSEPAPAPEPAPPSEPELPPEPETAPQAPPESEPAPDQPQEVVPPSEPVVQSLGG